MNLGFQFKQFYVRHDRCAMKVGTDGVLLGAWAQPDQVPLGHVPCTILDVGTGSGLIALMLAQRLATSPLPSPEEREKGFHIDAIDIDEAAVSQAAENFAASPWSDRLHAHLSRLQDWQIVHRTSVFRTCYDLIVSNPPYFRNSLKNPDKGREMARHTDTLSYDELLAHSARLLAENGMLAVILPAEAEEEVRTAAQRYALSPVRVTRVYSKESKPAIRTLMSFCRNGDTSRPRSLAISTLILEDDNGARSAAYRDITKDFYL